MNPISDTAYICAGLRMLDAEEKNPICGDTYARYFMNGHGLKILDKFRQFENYRIGNLVRHRIIDDLIKRELQSDPDTTIILNGAGFDTRAYRMNGGNWIEVDEAQIIEYKNSRLPVDKCRNSLKRISHNFSSGSLEQALDQYRKNSNIMIIVEGVFRYLEVDEVIHFIKELQKLFPEHQLVCDLMSRKFYEKYASMTSNMVKEMGAPFRFNEKRPELIFLTNGYQLIDKISVMKFAFDSGFMKNPGILPVMFQRTLLDGYSIYHFNYS